MAKIRYECEKCRKPYYSESEADLCCPTYLDLSIKNFKLVKIVISDEVDVQYIFETELYAKKINKFLKFNLFVDTSFSYSLDIVEEEREDLINVLSDKEYNELNDFIQDDISITNDMILKSYKSKSVEIELPLPETTEKFIGVIRG